MIKKINHASKISKKQDTSIKKTPEESTILEPKDVVDIDPVQAINTKWGYKNENEYNKLIVEVIPKKWGNAQPPLDGLLVKSLIAQESGFNPLAVSVSGCVGLMQLGRLEALDQGLKLEPVDERTIPEKCIPAGIGALRNKLNAIMEPPGEDYDWAKKVEELYVKYGGKPEGEQIWMFTLGSYNGGQGTVWRSMCSCDSQKKDPRKWDNLINPKEEPTKSPLYAGILDVYGEKKALKKYYEMSNYPIQILNRLKT